MRTVNAQAIEICEQDILKKIELCGRVCYKSEGQISEGSALRFVKMLISRNHLAMTEHAPLVLSVTKRMAKEIKKLGHGTFLNVTMNESMDRYLVSGNVRAWRTLFVNTDEYAANYETIEKYEIYMQMSLGQELYDVLFPNVHTCATIRNYLLTQQDILSLPNLRKDEAMTHLYLTAHFICDRGVSHELVRHRPASFAQESTRYCNYGKKSFGREITFIDPGFTGESRRIWSDAMLYNEKSYFELLDMGFAPQQARGVLPVDVKTEVVMTCNLEEWQHVINLRYHGTTGAPHPHMLELMELWYKLIKSKEGYNKWID